MNAHVRNTISNNALYSMSLTAHLASFSLERKQTEGHVFSVPFNHATILCKALWYYSKGVGP